jgi:D-alanyl-D-alanine carboxypeptidase/D-alanyl-D-alanine-endopeptidase (penicillin-binding protein 4)
MSVWSVLRTPDVRREPTSRGRIVLLAGALTLALSAPAPAATTETQLRRELAAAFAPASPASGALVVDALSGHVVFARRASTPRIPASVEKLYTSSAALLAFGSGHTFQTRILGDGTIGPNGIYDGSLYLVGGGDPLFGAQVFNRSFYGINGTTTAALAALIASRGITQVTGRVVGDESRFDQLRGTASEGFKPSVDLPPLSALAYNRGLADRPRRGYQTSPARAGAAGIRAALRLAGVAVPGTTAAGTAPAGAGLLATVSSPPLSTIVGLMNRPSDNWIAEMLVKGLGARFGSGGSTASGAAVVRARIAALGVRPTIVDGSGLSRGDRTSPRQVVNLLLRMGSHALAPILRNSLAVAGRSGTLATRMRGTAAQDRCRGKTGTLSDVSGLAGYCTALDGRVFVFALLMNRTRTGAARAIQDKFAVRLASYRSAAPAPTVDGGTGGAGPG